MIPPWRSKYRRERVKIHILQDVRDAFLFAVETVYRSEPLDLRPA